MRIVIDLPDGLAEHLTELAVKPENERLYGLRNPSPDDPRGVLWKLAVDAVAAHVERTPAETAAFEVMRVLRTHLAPHCHTGTGDLPFADSLTESLTNDPTWFEWTIDAMGHRDWKLDRDRSGRLSVRYRGSSPEGHAAAAACNAELATLDIERRDEPAGDGSHLECSEAECRLSLSLLDINTTKSHGWHYTAETGWLCPGHAPTRRRSKP